MSQPEPWGRVTPRWSGVIIVPQPITPDGISSFGWLALLPLSVLDVSVRLPPEFDTPPTAVAKALAPPRALALFPLTVLLVSVTALPGAELRMPPNASLGVLPLFPLTVLSVSTK